MKKSIFSLMALSCAILVLLTSCSKKLSDEEAAKNVADLIDAIYVQQRTDKTDKQCADAKKAWDALTDVQKEMVEGEEADPDYFGRDTGDASKDNPLNQDGISENEILVVSFGTSFNDSRAQDIGSIEKAIQNENPDWSVRRAFTAQIIINHVQARDNEKIDNMTQALDRAVKNKVKNLVIQPTHLMHGAEYDELAEEVEKYASKFDSIVIAEPLLGEVGKTEDSVNTDKESVAKAITAEAVKLSGYGSLADAKAAKTAFVFMGHGTSHKAKITYTQMSSQMKELGYSNVFIGTVEGEPEETSCESVIEAVKAAGYTKVILRPLMVVAGDHANNDMAGDDDDSWKSMFSASRYFESVDSQIEGLGRIPAVIEVYKAHTKDAIIKMTSEKSSVSYKIPDGKYSVKFSTDSSMFGVNETKNGRGELSVTGGKMTLHVTLKSKSILNLYYGLAEKAETDKDNWLQPTVDTVVYEDGTKEEVFGFDVPVSVYGSEFDLALVGTKGKWYDHKVSITEIE